jgi:DNA polymerase-1
LTLLYTDIEADSLKPTRIWCVCVNESVYTNKQDFVTFFNQHKEATWVFHNGIGFDVPVLERLWGVSFDRARVVDTLVLGRLANPSREAGHSLASYGEALGFPKGDHSDWSQCTPEMIEYCLRDVQVTKRLHEYLLKELQGFSEQSIQLEHQVAWIITEQTRNGWLLDQRKCYTFLGGLKQKLMELEDTVLSVFKPLPVFEKEVTPKYKLNGDLSSVGLKFFGEDQWQQVAGPFSRISW